MSSRKSAVWYLSPILSTMSIILVICAGCRACVALRAMLTIRSVLIVKRDRRLSLAEYPLRNAGMPPCLTFGDRRSGSEIYMPESKIGTPNELEIARFSVCWRSGRRRQPFLYYPAMNLGIRPCVDEMIK